MKVLMLNGSPHDSGVNDLALREMEAIFKENGVETEIVQVGNVAVRGCMACGACTKLGKCVYDDIVNELLPKFEEADGLVVSSPVYYASANATLVAVLDRLFYCARFDKTMKVGASVVSCRRGGASATFDELNKYLHSQAKKLGIELKEGRAHSSDVFYHPNPNFSWQSVRDEHGCGAVEMESFALFATAKYLNKRATCLLTISDSFITHEVTTAEERQNSFTNMMKIALSLADF